MRKRLPNAYRQAMRQIIEEHERKYHSSMVKRFLKKFVRRKPKTPEP